MSAACESSPNPALKRAVTEGGTFGGRGDTGTYGLIGGSTAKTASVSTFLFGGHYVKAPSSGLPRSLTAHPLVAPSATTRVSSTGATKTSTCGDITNSSTVSAFGNTRSLFEGTPTPAPMSTFGGKAASETESGISTVKSSNVFSSISETVVNVPSLFGNVSSTSEAIGMDVCAIGVKTMEPTAIITDKTVKPMKAKPICEAKTSAAASRVTDNFRKPAKDSDVSVPILGAADFAALAQVKAITSKEKYSLLDARDKLIRKHQTKVVDCKKAHYLSATCMDMCPEKERYMREAQHDLNSYEMTANRKIDHKRAVKKFSRSSADKHEPLPHELRTGAVLVRTMDYLMCNIMPDLEEDSKKNVALCYNYLWDRTRAMRSDIMQQHLLDTSAVYVLERCVRFHIYCSERLCLEPPHVFDPKMNAEHLRKSLHSLKELYHDLAEDSIFISSESEFRAYEILLNIDDGNIMFAYLHFRESVRKSPEVQFAVEVLHSVQTNNFVRFFRLVKKATFLQACILHKYFSRIRSQALAILMKASHCPRQCQSISLSKLTGILLFEDPDDTRSFLASNGLSLDTRGGVVLDRKIFIPQREETPSLSRARNVIGSKKVRSVGEEINGGTLPDNPLFVHQPCNSFSHEGFLIAAACASEEKIDSLRSFDSVAEGTCSGQSTSESSSYGELSNESCSRNTCANLSYTDGTLEERGEAESVDSSCRSESAEFVFSSQDDVTEENDGDDIVTNGDILEGNCEEPSLSAFYNMSRTEVVDNAVNSICGDSFDYSNEEKARDFCIRKLQMTCFSKWRRLCMAKRKIFTLHQRFICRSAMRKWQQFVARKKLERLSLEVRQKLSEILVRSCFKQWRHFTVVSKITKKNRENRKTLVALKYCRLWWKKTTEMKRKISRLTDGFPAAPSRLSIAEQNEVWSFSCKGIRCSYTRLYSMEENLEAERRKASVHDKLSASMCSTPLPVQSAFQRFIDSRTVPNISKPKFFTLVICFMDDVDKYVMGWLRSKLNPLRNGNSVSINCSYKLSSRSTNSQHVVQFVEAKRTDISKIAGVSSVLYISDAAKEPSPSDFARADVQSPNSKRFALSRKDCSSALTSLSLVNTLVELYKNSASQIRLHKASLPQVVESFISRHVFDVAARTERRCTEIGYAPLPPQCYHVLYERALLHLRNILLDQRLQGKQWRAMCPETRVPVVGEMSEPSRRAIADALEQCRLPVIPSTNWTSWSQAFKGLMAFIKQEFDVTPSSPEAGLIENVSFIMHRAKECLMSASCGSDSDIPPSTLLLPWKDIYFSLILHKLQKLPDIDVICCNEDLASYNNNDSWFLPHLVPVKSLTTLKRKAATEVDETNFVPKKPKREAALVSLLHEELKKTEILEKRVQQILEDGDRPISSLFDSSDSEVLRQESEEIPENISNSDSSLLRSISEEKLRFDSLERKLLRIIQ